MSVPTAARSHRNIRSLGYTGDILSIEANPSVCEKLETMASNDRGWVIKNVAIGLTEGTLELFTTTDDSFSSSKLPNEYSLATFGATSEVTGSTEVEQLPLRMVVESLESETGRSYERVFLKSDTQGMDRDVIRSCESLLSRIAVLLVEMPLKPIYNDLPSFTELYAEYESLGFELVSNSPVSWGNHGELIEIDCLFQRQRAPGPAQ